jgi:hypothetical protein
MSHLPKRQRAAIVSKAQNITVSPAKKELGIRQRSSSTRVRNRKFHATSSEDAYAEVRQNSANSSQVLISGNRSFGNCSRGLSRSSNLGFMRPMTSRLTVKDSSATRSSVVRCQDAVSASPAFARICVVVKTLVDTIAFCTSLDLCSQQKKVPKVQTTIAPVEHSRVVIGRRSAARPSRSRTSQLACAPLVSEFLCRNIWTFGVILPHKICHLSLVDNE